MRCQIVGKNKEVPEVIAGMISKKLSRMERYFATDASVSSRVLVTATRLGVKIEITIFTPQMDFRAEVEADDVACALDQAIAKLQGQMRRLKTRFTRSGRKKTGLGRSLALSNIEAEEVTPIAEQVVRTKAIYLAPMTLEEAIIRMEAIDHDFFIFLDVEEGRVKVAYARKEGGYGVIEVENELKKKEQ